MPPGSPQNNPNHRCPCNLIYPFMNIFVLSLDPAEAAQMQCDKHVVKMCSETAQLLCSQHPPGTAPWKRTHYNHPCSIWCRQTTGNYQWLVNHGMELCQEYTRRYGRRHAAQNVIEWCRNNLPTVVPAGPLTQFAIAIRDPKYLKADAVSSYRAYYLGDKSRFARWRYCDPPNWWML